MAEDKEKQKEQTKLKYTLKKQLAHLREMASGPVLIGTWADAAWAIRFYRRHGFEVVTPQEKNRLLKKYWKIPERQIETSVVLADERWRELADRT